MATFAQLKTRAATRMKDENNQGISGADVGQSINDAIAFWKNKRFWFNEAYDDVTLTIGNNTVTMPTSPAVLFPLKDGGMVIDYSNSKWKLCPINSNEYDYLDDAGQGMPEYYTFRGGSWVVYPYPDQAYSLDVRYIKEYSALTSDADTNDFTNYADQLILYEALSRLYGEFWNDANMSQYYSTRAGDEYKALLQRSSNTIGSGRLSVETIL